MWSWIGVRWPDRLAIAGVDGDPRPEAEVAEILDQRRARWTPQPPRHTSGILSLHSQVATGASHGTVLGARHDG